MVTQFDIDATQWTPITAVGRQGLCWLDLQDDGAANYAECYVIESSSTPSAADLSIAQRVYKPTKNNDYLPLESELHKGRFWARCKNTGDTVKISVKIKKTNDLNELCDQGRLFFLQNRTRASASDRVFLIRTGSKNAHVLISIEAGLATEIDFYEGVTVTTVGSAVVLRSMNRDIADDSLITKVYGGATVSLGTLLSLNQAGFGSNPGLAASGSAGESVKYILKANTDYAYIVGPDSATDTKSRSFIWEE